MSNGKHRNPDGTFAEGNSGKPKGAISEKTRIWNEIGDWFSNEGLEAYQQELLKMKDEDPAEFMKRYETMMEYFKPKLARRSVDVTSGGEKLKGFAITIED